MAILSVDTSTIVCSVAIHEKGKLLANVETYTDNSHAENLALMIQQASDWAKIPLDKIEAFALSKGPGSYTGLRIGCSTLKGLCFAFDKPLIAISTLRILVEAFVPVLEEADCICPLLDARRMEVYTAAYDKEGNERMKEQALVLDEHSFSDLLSERNVLFVGNGVPKFKEIMHHPRARFVSDVVPLAKHMGQLAFDLSEKQLFVDVAYFEPDYLKEFYTTAKVTFP
jgi:tRNA threonylcarbamoyladenosine biosynthesis protein TsaB